MPPCKDSCNPVNKRPPYDSTDDELSTGDASMVGSDGASEDIIPLYFESS